jgi:hypothetical protein
VALDQVFRWTAPDYTLFDDERFEVLLGEVMDRKIWIISMDKALESMEDYLRGMVKPSRTSKPVCMYAGLGNARFTTPRMKTEVLKVFRLSGEIEGSLSLIYLTAAQMNLLRSEYLKASINPASTSVNFGVLAGDKLIGRLGYTSPMFPWAISVTFISWSILPSGLPSTRGWQNWFWLQPYPKRLR